MTITTSSETRTTKPWRLSGRPRKAALVTHIVSAGTWFGMDIVMLRRGLEATRNNFSTLFEQAD